MKILVIQKKRIGDVLTSTVILEALRINYPDAKLHFLVYENSIAVVKNSPFIDKIVVLDEKSRKGKRAFLSFLFQIRKEKYDIVVDAYGKPNSVIIAWFSGAKKTISFAKSYSKLLLTDVVERMQFSESSATKAIEHRLSLLEVLGIKSKTIAPKIFLSDVEIEQAKSRLIQNNIDINTPIVMISVIGSNENKTYPNEYMAKVLDTIVDFGEVQILFNYIPYQKKQAKEIYDLCAKETRQKINFDFFEDDLRNFLATTQLCSALIGNEGGAVNMAKALQVPTFCIFSPGVTKTDWNIFENETTNVSVHLHDYLPKSNKKQDILSDYKLFEPQLFRDKLLCFLNFNCK
jgi:heptosyltransferase II